jgi:hypothetical protein
MTLSSEMIAPDLPPYSLDVQPLELGDDTKAIGLELLETESREPLRGPVAAQICSALFPALAAKESLVVDFFSHLERVREFCKLRGMVCRETASRCLVLTQPSQEQLRLVFERFAKETFGIRVGSTAEQEDAVLENELSHRGLDAYQGAYSRYTFCAVCEPEDAWVTLLSDKLWPSEVIRRVRPALRPFDVYLARPQ